MTNGVTTTLLFSGVKASLNQWASREAAVLRSLNLLLLAHYREQLAGAAVPGIREAIGLAMQASDLNGVKAHLGVVLRQP